jgi:hypothetical protein
MERVCRAERASGAWAEKERRGGERRGRKEYAKGKGEEMGGAIAIAMGIRMGVAVRSEERDGLKL